MAEQNEAQGSLEHLKTTWHIEMLLNDTWHGCTSPRTDAADIISVWDFRKQDSPDAEHRLVQIDVRVVDPEEIRKIIPQKSDGTQDAVVHSD
jgi:hypothetical protein